MGYGVALLQPKSGPLLDRVCWSMPGIKHSKVGAQILGGVINLMKSNFLMEVSGSP